MRLKPNKHHPQEICNSAECKLSLSDHKLQVFKLKGQFHNTILTGKIRLNQTFLDGKDQ